MLSVGLFGQVDDLDNNLFYPGLLRGGGFRLLGVQLAVVVVISLWTSVVSFIILKVIDLTVGIRVPLHEELLGADVVEHSVNGSFDKRTGEWFDVSGKLVMTIDTTSEENYQRSIEMLRLRLRNDMINKIHSGGRRHSAFGFSRALSSSSRKRLKNGRPTVSGLSRSADCAESFTELATISSNGIHNGIAQRAEGRNLKVVSHNVDDEKEVIE